MNEPKYGSTSILKRKTSIGDHKVPYVSNYPHKSPKKVRIREYDEWYDRPPTLNNSYLHKPGKVSILDYDGPSAVNNSYMP